MHLNTALATGLAVVVLTKSATGIDIYMMGNSFTGQSGQDYAFAQWVIESCDKQINSG